MEPRPAIETVRHERHGDTQLWLIHRASGYSGRYRVKLDAAIDVAGGLDLDHAWQQLLVAAKLTGDDWKGWKGARDRFLRLFPAGFDDPAYLSRERHYKVGMKELLDASAPLEQALAGKAGLEGAVAAVMASTKLLSPFEQSKLTKLFKSADGGAFVRASAHFAAETDPDAMEDLRRIAKEHRCASWPTVTWLPSLWRPKVHIFLKPEATRKLATRLADPFAAAYAPTPEMRTYAAFQAFAHRIEANLAAAGMPARDMIDVQGFISVVCGTADALVAKAKAARSV